MLQKLVKQRRESLAIFEQQARADLALIESEEIEVLERYLPKQLDGEALEAIVRNIITETGATGVKDMGKVMGAATKQLAGQADGKVVGEVVKRLLGL